MASPFPVTSGTSASPTGEETASAREFNVPSLLHAIGRRGLIQIAVLVVLVVAVYWHPIKLQILHRWRYDATWSYGWLVPIFSLYFLHTQRAKLAAVPIRPSYVGLLVLLTSLGCYFTTIWVYPMGYPRALTLISVVFSLILFVGGWGVLKLAWFPIAFLALGIPLPQSIYVHLTMPLQKLASHATATVLNLLPSVHAEMSGVVVDYSYAGVFDSLNVEQACSGMRSMMAIVTLGFALAYLGVRPMWQRVVMAASCVPIAICCNVFRVTVTGLLHVFQDSSIGRALRFEWLVGPTPHAIFGLVTFLMALGLYLLLGWVLANLFVEESVAEGGVESP
jgi:exosortase